LATPYLQEQVNRHGNVKIMCRVKMLGCWQKTGERHEYSFTARQFKCSRNDGLMQKLMNAQQERRTHIENVQLHESGIQIGQVISIWYRGLWICYLEGKKLD
jgi:hypothetical protein